MSNLIDVIEHWGRDAQWRHATDEAREAALIAAGLEPDVRTVMLTADQDALESLLGVTHNICCMINAPEEEKEEEHEDEDDGKHDEEEESEDEDKE
jgi:hypothetical protein